MQSADYDIRETDPFKNISPIKLSNREMSPYVNRIRLMWHEMRSSVIKFFPKTSGIPKNHKKYLKLVEEIYVTDAYHSLSIARYRVTSKLIVRVRSGEWDSKKMNSIKTKKTLWRAEDIGKQPGK